MRISHDDQGLRCSFSSDLAQLRHISGQMEHFFLFQDYIKLDKSQAYLKITLKICRIHLAGLFGSALIWKGDISEL
jgi:hypothetical protein